MKLMARAAAFSFEAWRDRVDERALAREKIAVAVARVTASTLTRAFNSWAHATEAAWARRVKGERAERLLSKVLDSKMSRAFAKWKECVEDSRKKVHFLSGHERARALKAQCRALRVMSAWKGYTIRKAIGRSTRDGRQDVLERNAWRRF